MIVFLLALSISLQARAIENFHLVSSGIYRGARPVGRDLEILSHRGIRTIVNLQGGDGEVLWLSPLIRQAQPGERPEAVQEERVISSVFGIGFIHAPMNSFLPVQGQTEKSIQAALAVLMDSNRHPVFIHCQFGRDRTGLIIALYRVFKEGWSPEAAHNEWVALGHSGLGGIFTSALDAYFWSAVRASGRAVR